MHTVFVFLPCFTLYDRLFKSIDIPETDSFSPFYGTSLVAQTVKRLPTMQETRVRSLGWEDALEKEMATHSSTLAWKIPWMEEPGRLQSMGLQSRTRLSDFAFSRFSLLWLKYGQRNI